MYRLLFNASFLLVAVTNVIIGLPVKNENDRVDNKVPLGDHQFTDDQRNNSVDTLHKHQRVSMVITNISQICAYFRITPENCSCDKFPIPKSPLFSQDLCKVLKDIDKPKYVLVYNSALSRTQATVSILASLVSTFGNGAIITIAYRNWDSLSNTRLLITLLSICHFAFGLLQVIPSVPMFWTNEWLYGNALCKILHGAKTFGPVLSIGFLLVIAIERFSRPLYDLKREVSRGVLYIVSGVNVVIGLLLVTPLLLVLSIEPNLPKCSTQWPGGSSDSLKYNISLLLLSIVFPTLFVCFVYIWMTLKHTNNSSYIMRENTTEPLQKGSQEHRRMSTIIITILAALVICVLPNRAVWIYLDINNYVIGKDLYKILSYVALVPFPLYVAVNPIIYCIVDKTWRRDICNTLACREKIGVGVRSMSVTDDKSSVENISIIKLPTRSVKRDENSEIFGSANIHKTYGGISKNEKMSKDDKERNLSADHGTHLL